VEDVTFMPLVVFMKMNDRSFKDCERTFCFYNRGIRGFTLTRSREHRAKCPLHMGQDRERTFEELESLFFYILYLWTTTFISHLVISYYDFLVLFSFCS
jgi:hypothetical protein